MYNKMFVYLIKIAKALICSENIPQPRIKRNSHIFYDNIFTVYILKINKR